MISLEKRSLARAAALVAVASLAACTSSDRLPPKGSTITVAANPATIPLATSSDCFTLLGSSAACGTADIVATVASEIGVPLPDQDVRFSSTAGFLYTGSPANPVNAANIPIRTDKFGNASVSLITSATATVTAKSGQATAGTLTINTVSGNLNAIVLNLDTTTSGCNSSPILTSCSGQTLCFTATAQDTGGQGIKGVVLTFNLQNNVVNGSTLNGTFVQQTVTTDNNGVATTKFTPDSSTCSTQCSAAQGKSCRGDVIAALSGGSFQSGVVSIQVNAP